MLLFALLGVLWGASFLLIRISLQGLNPAQVGLLRLALGAATLTVIMLATRRPWPCEPRLLGHLTVVAVLLFVIPVALYSWAGQFLPSSLSAVLNATTPLMTLLVSALALRGERLRPAQVGGVLLGAAGIALVVAPWQGSGTTGPPADASWPAIAACLLATLSYGCAYTWLRKFLLGPATAKTARDPLSLTAVQLLIATLLTALAAPWTDVFATVPRLDTPIVIAMLVLGVFSTGIGYLWNTSITARWGAVRASQVTYLTPIVGVVLGAAILAEPIGWLQLAGTATVLAGIALTQLQRARAPRAPTTTSD